MVQGTNRPAANLMFGDLIGKGLCGVGIHWVESWTYRRLSSCTQDGFVSGAGTSAIEPTTTGDVCILEVHGHVVVTGNREVRIVDRHID